MKSIRLLIVGVLLMAAAGLNAQVDQPEKIGQGTGMSAAKELMNDIASDSTMRKEMLSKMVDQVKNDPAAMKSMVMELMKNPGMRKTMMDMVGKESSGMGGRMKEGMEHEMGDTMKMPHNL